MSTLKTSLLAAGGVFGLAVVGVLGYAATQPDTFKVERATTIQAPPAAVYPHVADFHKWTAWSPWEKLDPNLQRTYGGATSGKGATYAWAGSKDVGKGSMAITEADEPNKLLIDLRFTEPFQAENLTTFAFTPDDGGTKVTWTMEGKNPFIGKVMHLFMDMDAMVGKDFEKGLADLKAVAEKR